MMSGDEFYDDEVTSGPIERRLGNWTPETLAARIATGDCAIVREWCFTHETRADFGHYLDTRPAKDYGHDPVSGMAYDD